MDLLFQMHSPQRRGFIKGLADAALGLFVATSLGGCEALLQKIRDRPTRRRLTATSAAAQADLQTYRSAVQAMKALPASDGRSWAAQAAIHGSVTGGFNFCQHGTPHFFSWHRAYLFFLEDICRGLTGESRFALPYWNWNQDGQMDPAFTVAGSPLFHPRNVTNLTGFAPVSNTSLDPILDDPNFLTFSGTLEGPHGDVHVRIGQDMRTGGSAIDPVFWMHHCMIDYCWAKWNLELGFDNPNDASWVATSWNHFFRRDGSPVTMTAGATTLMPLLSYQYEPSAIGTHAVAAEVRAAEDFAQLRRRVEAGAPVQLDIRQRFLIAETVQTPIGRPYSSPPVTQASALTGLLTERDPASNLFLNVEYARFPEANDFFVRVFVNLPGANAATPTTDVHYAGSLSFFGSPGGRHEQMHATKHLVNVTQTLRALMQRGELREGSPVTVQLVAVPADAQFRRPDLVLQLNRIELLATPIRVTKPAGSR
ncbi:tyrosinase family protein [Variovorax sp. J22R24]|uniref:tyrosinase family protein n=1 Tax=Variovorax gracilis TaxID=3053502 RepID=UPI0025757662|nr:tyrosinase family protein [Variovorax sp. J22R24]MDM0109059.1 tyrosinase family protein [Variovorax sp. J22R24]